MITRYYFLLISVHYYYAKNSIDAVAFHKTILHFTYALIIQKHLYIPIHKADFIECVLPRQPLWCVCDAKLGLVGGGGEKKRRGFSWLLLNRVLTFLLSGAKKLNFS